MQKPVLIFFLSFLVFGIALNSPLILAQTTPENPGVTPDSFFWGLDRALEQISLLLAASPNSEAKIGLEIAGERLSEIKVMIEENKLEAAEKAQEKHGETLSGVEQNIEEIDEDNSEDEIKEVIKIEKDLQDHNNEVDQVSGELKIKIKIDGELTQEQMDLIDSLLESLKGKIGDIEIEIENKKDKIKIKIKQETGKSDEEINDDIKRFELESGVAEIKVGAEIIGNQAEVKIEREFSIRNTSRNEIINEIISEFALDLETANSTLEIEDEEDEEEELEEKFKVEVKVEDGIAEVEVKLRFILNSTDRQSILDAIVERSQLTVSQINAVMEFEVEDEDNELEIEVEVEDGIAEVEVEFAGEEFEFTLETTDRETIISEIIKRTGLTREEIEDVMKFKIKDNDDDDDLDDE